MDSELTHVGSGSTKYSYDSPDKGILEVFNSPRQGAYFVVGLECFEFTSLCPITSQPDFGQIHILYVPGDLCVESKSLKLYLGAYRNHGAFHEDCVNTILEDLVSVMDPIYLRVLGDFNARGGIAIKPLALKWKTSLNAEDKEQVSEMVSSYDRLSLR